MEEIKTVFDSDSGNALKSYVEIKHLKKVFGDKVVLRDINYTFEEGKIYSIIGRNGAGKTTLFNVISGNLKSDGGEITINNGEDKRKITFDDLGMVSASPVLPEFLTGFEFIRYYLDFTKKNKTGKIEDVEVEDWLRLVKIEGEDMHKLIRQYSFGMKNKLQLLLCLIRNPKIILLDEPLSSFDIIVSHEIKEFLIKMKADHIIVLSTHIMQLAQDISDEVVLLKDGILETPKNMNIHSDDFVNYIIEELKN